jgi:hypothetical protein
MPLQATSGAASYDAFGGGAAAVPNYIEEVFSTYLYTGTGAAQTITNGIDLSTKGGLVWTKNRVSTYNNVLIDTARGSSNFLMSDQTSGQLSNSTFITSFNANGYTLGTGAGVNAGGENNVGWTFRKQPKFFDVVTYTGNGASNRTVAHNLASTPGCIMVKRTDSTGDWYVFHRAVTETNPNFWYMRLNSTAALSGAPAVWDNPAPTATTFTVQPDTTNINGATYVAYLFAHNAGGFGLTGTDNVISCGSYSGTGVANNITLGYEPQWVMVKRTDSTADWVIMDAMRSGFLEPNTSDAESGGSWFSLSGDNFFPTATGFQINTAGPAWNASGGSYIYIAIRRGPMKVPTSGTSVFTPTIGANLGAGGGLIANAGFPPDLHLEAWKNTSGKYWFDRLRGANAYIQSTNTSAEANDTGRSLANMLGMTYVTTNNFSNAVVYDFRRAPSFFDEVCYTGTGVNNQAFTHNLGAVPELMIIKMRVFSSGTGFWFVYSSTLGYANYLLLNSTAASASGEVFGNQNPNSSSFYVSNGSNINNTASQYVAYLFATCAGVSKVGSYTGNGSSQTINCGFTGGARFVLVKATSTTGNWIVADSARGIVAGNDPALYLNSTAAEVTGLDWIDADNSGFVVNETATIAANTNGVSYIFLAVA